jgi:hypothetical protein
MIEHDLEYNTVDEDSENELEEDDLYFYNKMFDFDVDEAAITEMLSDCIDKAYKCQVRLPDVKSIPYAYMTYNVLGTVIILDDDLESFISKFSSTVKVNMHPVYRLIKFISH